MCYEFLKIETQDKSSLMGLMAFSPEWDLKMSHISVLKFRYQHLAPQLSLCGRIATRRLVKGYGQCTA